MTPRGIHPRLGMRGGNALERAISCCLNLALKGRSVAYLGVTEAPLLFPEHSYRRHPIGEADDLHQRTTRAESVAFATVATTEPDSTRSPVWRGAQMLNRTGKVWPFGLEFRGKPLVSEPLNGSSIRLGTFVPFRDK